MSIHASSREPSVKGGEKKFFYSALKISLLQNGTYEMAKMKNGDYNKGR